MNKTYPQFPILQQGATADGAVGASNVNVTVPANTVWARLTVIGTACRYVVGGTATGSTGSILPEGGIEVIALNGATTIGIITAETGKTGTFNVTRVEP
jgi:hypothetical protein